MLLFLITPQHTISFAWDNSTLPCTSACSHEACGPLMGNSSSIAKKNLDREIPLLSCRYLCLIWFYCGVFGKHNMATDYKLFEHVGVWQLKVFTPKKPYMMENNLLRMMSMSKSTSFCHYELSPCIILPDHVQSFIQVRLRPAYAHIVRAKCIFTNWCSALQFRYVVDSYIWVVHGNIHSYQFFATKTRVTMKLANNIPKIYSTC